MHESSIMMRRNDECTKLTPCSLSGNWASCCNLFSKTYFHSHEHSVIPLYFQSSDTVKCSEICIFIALSHGTVYTDSVQWLSLWMRFKMPALPYFLHFVDNSGVTELCKQCIHRLWKNAWAKMSCWIAPISCVMYIQLLTVQHYRPMPSICYRYNLYLC